MTSSIDVRIVPSIHNENHFRESPTFRPVGTTRAVPIILGSRWEGFLFKTVNICGLLAGIQAYNGYATKLLLSSMFELIFQLPEMTSAYMSAITLLPFLIGSFIVPYFVIRTGPMAPKEHKGYSPGLICTITQCGACVAYGVLPSIIGTSEFSSAKFTWRLFGFIIAKSFVSFTFAVMQGLTASVAVDAIGVANIGIIFIFLYDAVFFAAAGGPISAWLITFARYYLGFSFAKAFALFFYIGAGLSALGALFTGWLYMETERNIHFDAEEQKRRCVCK